MANGEIIPRVTVFLGPGFSSTSPHGNRNSDSSVIEIPAIVKCSGVNGPRALDLHLM